MIDSFVDRTGEAKLVADTVDDITTEYGHDYWRECAAANRFPDELWDVLAERGFLGLLVPEEYGGEGLGLRELDALIEGFTRNGVRLLYLIIHVTMAPVPIERHGSDALKERFLPEIASGDGKFCFAITEADAGTNAFKIRTRAERDGDEYVVDGEKTYITGAADADYIQIVTRTTPYEAVADEDRREGGTLLVVPTDADGVSMEPLDLAITETVDQYTVHFDQVRVPVENRIGQEGKGFYHVFDALNPERIAGASEAVGLGRFVLDRAVAYAKEREVFDAPIGSHQALQHDLSEAKIDVEQAALATQRAIDAFEANFPEAGSYANVANYASTEAANRAFDVAVQTHGGNGLSRDYDIVTLQNNIRLGRIAPVTNQMILNSVGENVLGLPKSY